MPTTIIGIDCAVDARNIGLAKALFADGSLSVVKVGWGGTHADLVKVITRWIGESSRVLLALDAPLGWPERLSGALAHHAAGAALEHDGEEMFLRQTDAIVAERCRRRPFDVGADRVTRTGLAALRLLGALSRANGAVPLAWTPAFPDKVAAIEVNPAATLSGRGIRCHGYKRPGDVDVRRGIVERLADHIDLKVDRADLIDDADRLDAVVSTLAGADFLRDDTVKPDDPERARREGWIWFRPPV